LPPPPSRPHPPSGSRRVRAGARRDASRRRGFYSHLLVESRGLASPATQIEQLRAANFVVLEHLDVGDRGAVERERALDAHAFADLPHREALADAAAANVDDLAAELLLALFVAFDDA